MSSDTVRIEQLPVTAIIGILPQERTAEQPLTCDLELQLDATSAALTGELSHSVDYAALAQELSFILRAGRFRLLETAALALANYVLSPRTNLPVGSARVTLRKPRALGGLGVPSLTVSRTPAQIQVNEELYSGGILQRLFTSREVSIWRIKGTLTGLPEAHLLPHSEDLQVAPGVVLRVMTRS